MSDIDNDPNTIELQEEPTPPDSGSNTSSFPMPPDEFCRRLSVTNRQPEMIGAFYASVRNKMPMATEAEFRDAYEAFARAPA